MIWATALAVLVQMNQLPRFNTCCQIVQFCCLAELIRNYSHSLFLLTGSNQSRVVEIWVRSPVSTEVIGINFPASPRFQIEAQPILHMIQDWRHGHMVGFMCAAKHLTRYEARAIQSEGVTTRYKIYVQVQANEQIRFKNHKLHIRSAEAG